MQTKHTFQTGKNLNSFGSIVKNKRIFQKGYNKFNANGYYLARRHRGRGIGSAFLGLARFLLPLLQSGFKAVKNEAISAGKDILNDIKDKQIENIVKNRGKMAVSNLKTKAVNKIDSMMSGEGLKISKSKKKSIKSQRNTKVVHTVNTNKRKRTNHIESSKNKNINIKIKKSKPKSKINIKEIFG